jgi:hypothetical protein
MGLSLVWFGGSLPGRMFLPQWQGVCWNLVPAAENLCTHKHSYLGGGSWYDHQEGTVGTFGPLCSHEKGAVKFGSLVGQCCVLEEREQGRDPKKVRKGT